MLSGEIAEQRAKEHYPPDQSQKGVFPCSPAYAPWSRSPVTSPNGPPRAAQSVATLQGCGALPVPLPPFGLRLAL